MESCRACTAKHFPADTDLELLASAHSELATLSQRKNLKPGDRVALTGTVTSQTIAFPNGETQTITRIALTKVPQVMTKEKRISTTVFEQNRRR